MAEIGDVEFKYGRRYTFINPDPDQGPGTWRLSLPDEYPSGGGTGGGSGTAYDFDAEAPVEVSMTPGIGTNPTVVTTKLDFIKLNAR